MAARATAPSAAPAQNQPEQMEMTPMVNGEAAKKANLLSPSAAAAAEAAAVEAAAVEEEAGAPGSSITSRLQVACKKTGHHLVRSRRTFPS